MTLTVIRSDPIYFRVLALPRFDVLRAVTAPFAVGAARRLVVVFLRAALLGAAAVGAVTLAVLFTRLRAALVRAATVAAGVFTGAFRASAFAPLPAALRRARASGTDGLATTGTVLRGARVLTGRRVAIGVRPAFSSTSAI